jgi:hypothetical protein
VHESVLTTSTIRSYVMAMSRRVSIAVTATAMLVAGGVGYAVFAPLAGGTAQPVTTGGSGATAHVPGSFQGNENSAHERAESAQREADEKAGRVHFGGPDGAGAFTPNTDPAHEKAESAARAAEENAGQIPTVP